MSSFTFRVICISLFILGGVIHSTGKSQELPPLKKDIEFRQVGDVSLKLDAFVPEGRGPFPTCILVHARRLADRRPAKQSPAAR